MKNLKLLVSGLVIFLLMASACSSGTKPADPGKPGGAAPAKPGAKPTPTKADTKKTKPGEKPAPPPGATAKTVPPGKKVPVPADWLVVYDENRGYEFQVPDGTTDDWQSVDDVDVYLASLPKPSNVAVMVVAYKDEATEKAVVLKKAQAILEKIGEKEVKFSDTKEDLNEDYYLVEFTSKDDKGVATKGKLLVGIDKTDNFLMFVASPEAEYEANKQIIDEVWSSFSMYSGGNSGNS